MTNVELVVALFRINAQVANLKKFFSLITHAEDAAKKPIVWLATALRRNVYLVKMDII